MRMFSKIAFLTAVLAVATLGISQTLTVQGAWSSLTTYAANDVVTYHGGIYKSLVNSNLNHTPPASSDSNWTLIHADIVYNADTTAQTNRPIHVRAHFADSEIQHYPKPLWNGSALSSGSWQENVDAPVGVLGNRWASGYVREADIYVITTLPSTGCKCGIITYTDDATGAHTGGLSAAQMQAFLDDTSNVWQAKMLFTVPAALSSSGSQETFTATARTMLNTVDPATNTTANGSNRYTCYGPVATCVVVQDNTSTFSNAFGWHFVGGVERIRVEQNGTSGCTTTSSGTVTIAGSPGSGATAHYVASGGVITSVVVDTAGSGYGVNTYAGTPVATASGTGCAGSVSFNVDIDAKMVDNGAGGPWTQGSAHPEWANNNVMFDINFYPTPGTSGASGVVDVGYIWEIGSFASRIQSQIFDITLQSASTDTVKWAHVGARKVSDASINSSAGGSGTLGQVTSATAAFTQSDENLQIWVPSWQNEDIGLARYVNGTTLNFPQQIYLPPVTTNLQLWINLHTGLTRHHKHFYSGTGLGNIRVDADFWYLASNGILPNYDPAVSASPDTTGNSNNGLTSWGQWTTQATSDQGEIGGWGGFNALDLAYSANSEGAPLQREDLLYWYNTGTCGTANSACAKAWQMLFGAAGTADTTLNNLSTGCHLYVNGTNTYCKDAGGLGTAAALSNVPIHYRESSTSATGQQSGTAKFYCAVFENKNIQGNATTSDCSTASDGTSGGDGNVPTPTLDNAAVGRALSIDAHSDVQLSTQGTLAGTFTMGGWGLDYPACAHWIDYFYTPYLLTGDYFLMEEMYQQAQFCNATNGPSNGYGYRNGFFGSESTKERSGAWTMQALDRAAYVAPQGSAEASYFKSKVLSTLEVQEGMMAQRNGVGGITSSLTPTVGNNSGALNTACTGFPANDYSATNSFVNTANRWEWGRCNQAYNLSQGGLSEAAWGLGLTGCGGVDSLLAVNGTNTQSSVPTYHFNWWVVALDQSYSHGITSILNTEKSFAARTLQLVNYSADGVNASPTRYLMATYLGPFRNISACTTVPESNGTYDSGVAQYLTNTNSTLTAANTFDTYDAVTKPHGIYQSVCADHGYSISARAAISVMKTRNMAVADANCQGGSCTGANAWTFAVNEIPYDWSSVNGCTWTSSGWTCGGAANSSNCIEPDMQIKYALAPITVSSPATSGGFIQTPNTIRTPGTVMQ